MNSYTLRITGTAEIPTPLSQGLDYTIKAQIAIPRVEKIDLENGNFEFLHKGKLINIELADKLGNSYKGTVKGSPSQKWRNIIGAVKGFDEYDSFMDKMIKHSEQVISFVEKL